jgi:hypothetical protein
MNDTHFLTIRRFYEEENIIEEREYHYNASNFTIDEVFVFRNPFNFEIEITGKERVKERDALDFVFNLEEMVNHPGLIFKDTEFILWYTDSILDDTLRPIS